MTNTLIGTLKKLNPLKNVLSGCLVEVISARFVMESWLFISIWGLNIQSYPLFIPSTMLVTGVNALEIQQFTSKTVTERAETVTERAEISTKHAITLFKHKKCSANDSLCIYFKLQKLYCY